MSNYGDSSSELSSDNAGDAAEIFGSLADVDEPRSPMIEETEPPLAPPLGLQEADAPVVHARAYQLEMYEESLKQNIIVAMDTGSGKTQVAVMRIQAELDCSPPGKIVWFLATTVALCEQQFKVLKAQIPAVQMKFISGKDKVDTWTNKTVWDDFLKNVGIVVSTHEILRDAISHAFVEMETLSLLVFDEAHNCVKNHPGSRIMTRYHELKAEGLPVPKILGLTASPVMSSKLEAIEEIEQTLDAVCKSPNKHKTELLIHVNRPIMECILYGSRLSESDPRIFTQSMASLDQALHRLQINNDPYIIQLKAEKSERSRTMLLSALKKKETYVFIQMRSFCRKSKVLRCELGAWAADYFIATAISQHIKCVATDDPWLANWTRAEKLYLANALSKVEAKSPFEFSEESVSTKVAALIKELLSYDETPFGIVFVKETATVAVLEQLLSTHPLTRERFRVGSMCGLSRHSSRKRDIGELKRPDDEASLNSFRSGEINLLIGTNVLEEGIDVPACNLVICFDKPSNLKSFIQRRGRARMSESRFVMLLDKESSSSHLKWQELEKEMKKKYEDELREIKEREQRDESAATPLAPFRIEKTGAKLDPEQAKSHLEHFCALLVSRKFVDCRPYYVMKEIDNPIVGDRKQIKATVVLPVSLPMKLRRVESANSWYSEKNACKDAAFQAYTLLYREGLINDHLLPFRDDELLAGVERRPATLEVRKQLDPWPLISKKWTESPAQVYRRPLRIMNSDQEIICEYDALLPVPIPEIPGFDVYWDRASPWKVELGEMSQARIGGEDQTNALISVAFAHRNVVPEAGSTHVIQFRSANNVEMMDQGQDRLVLKELVHNHQGSFPYLIRDSQGHPHFYEDWLPCKPALDLVKRKLNSELEEHPADEPWLALRKWPRGRDFLHTLPSRLEVEPSSKPYQTIWPASLCRYDATEITNVQFGSLIPGITHVIETYLVARKLSTSVLEDLKIRRLELIVTAISSPHAREIDNYQRFEFLGDSLLKLLTTLNVAVNHPNFPEGVLSRKKDLIVSNSRLCRAAVDAGLDEYILTTPFAGRWSLAYTENFYVFRAKEKPSDGRDMSTKVLADVVEALIGASYIDGGMTKALGCVRLLLPDMDWHGLEACRASLSIQQPVSDQVTARTRAVEDLIGYSFRNKSFLVDALTHGSHNVGTSTDSCLERLEFLGDAILDHVIVGILWEQGLSQQDMHLLRTASVNADLLGFCIMEWVDTQEASSISSPDHTAPGEVPTVTESEIRVPFWKFMRHSSSGVAQEQQAVEERHARLRGGIVEAMQHGSNYPWTLLASLDIPKFFSDLFESVLGAIWVDSGSLDKCRQMVELSGVSGYLRRMLEDKIDVMHPKNKLGELADCKKVRYDVTMAADGSFGCSVFVDDELVVEVENGIQREEARTRGAEAAYELLKRNSV